MRKETESRTDIFMLLYTYMTVYVQVRSANLKKRYNKIGNDSEKTHKVAQRHGMALTEEVMDQNKDSSAWKRRNSEMLYEMSK